MDFTAIDFEMANNQKFSVCSMGVCVVRNNRITNSYEYLVKPPKECGDFLFDNFHTGLHGITPERVRNSPTFGELWSRIRNFFEDKIVVAHSLPSVEGFAFNKLSEIYSLKNKNGGKFVLDYVGWTNTVCTCRLAKKLKILYPQKFSFEKTCLSSVAKHLGIGFLEDKHHGAKYDAEICAKILLAISEEIGKKDLAFFRSVLLGKVQLHQLSLRDF